MRLLTLGIGCAVGLSACVPAEAATKTSSVELVLSFELFDAIFDDGSGNPISAFDIGFSGLDAPFFNSNNFFPLEVGDGATTGSTTGDVNGLSFDDFAMQSGFMVPGDIMTITMNTSAMASTPGSIATGNLINQVFLGFETQGLASGPETIELIFDISYTFQIDLDNALPLNGQTLGFINGGDEILSDTVAFDAPAFIDEGFGDQLNSMPTQLLGGAGLQQSIILTSLDEFGSVTLDLQLISNVQIEVPTPGALGVLFAMGGAVGMRRARRS